MDRKTIIVVVICLGVLFFGNSVIQKLFPPVPLPAGATNAVTTATAPLTNPSVPAATIGAPTPALATPMPKPVLATSSEEKTLSFSNREVRYTFSSHGGGIKSIELLQYPETVSRSRKQSAGTNNVAELNTPQAAPVLTIFGDESVHDAGQFVLTQTAAGMRAEKSLSNGLRITKDFVVNSNFLVTATVRMENTANLPLTLSAQEWVIGTATPMDAADRGEAEGVIWYDGNKTEEKSRMWFDGGGFLFWSSPPKPEFRAGQSNVLWAAVHNQYFVLAAMPTNAAWQIVSRPLDLPRPPSGWASFTNNPIPKGLQTALVYPAATLAAGQVLERRIILYAGPKEYRTLARIAAQFQNNVDLVMNFGWVGFFSKALLRGMNWLHHTFTMSYGWCIIAITVIIKLIFWPITQAQSRMSRRMAALQPQMKELQAKYKDDPLKMQKKMSEFWKENKVNPMAGCLPMLIQLPIFFGFFTMIRSAIELRGASWLWVADLAKPDTLFAIPGLGFFPFTLFGATADGLPFNPLPLLMGVTMFWQAKLTPPSPGMDPVQQKMMKYLPLIFIVFLYNYSAGLALYWTVNNLLSVLQTKLIKLDLPGGPASSGPATAAVLTPASKKKK